MSLKYILNRIAPKIGAKIATNADEKLWLTSEVNAVAKEMYEASDLNGCLKEQVFALDEVASPADILQVTTPFYVHEIRGIKNWTGGWPLEINDMRPHYQTIGWNSSGYTWREKHNQALGRDIENSSKLIFSIPLAESVAITLSVIGATDLATRANELVTIPAGSLEAQTANNYVDAEDLSIEKTAYNTYDITVTDINDLPLALIPNSELISCYTAWQVRNTLGGGVSEAVEVLFKKRFTPMRNDYDEFPCKGYDDIIVVKFFEYWEASKEGGEQRALMANAKANQMMRQKSDDASRGKQAKIDFGRNPFREAQRYSSYGSFRHDRLGD